MQLVIAMLACVRGEPEGFDDSSFQGEPLLEEVAASCDPATDVLVLSARTQGWHEHADAHVWWDLSSDARPLDVHLSTELGFVRQDEWCDYMVSEPQDLGALEPPRSCDDLATATILVQVTYEEGCAGCAASDGADLDAVADRLGACQSECQGSDGLADECLAVLPVRLDPEGAGRCRGDPERGADE